MKAAGPALVILLTAGCAGGEASSTDVQTTQDTCCEVDHQAADQAAQASDTDAIWSGDPADEPGNDDAAGTDEADEQQAFDYLDMHPGDSDGPEATALDIPTPDDAAPGDETSNQPPPVFDMEMIRSQATAQCDFHDHRTVIKDGVLLDAWNLSYVSWESLDGELQPIVIRGFAARPIGSSVIPGVVYAHGLGGYAKEANATGTAALLGTFAIAYTGPGGLDPEAPDDPEKASEGLPAGYMDGYRMFDTIPDARGSWFWAHDVAAMRALTCLESRTDVDPDRLGITGHSGGAVASLVAAAVDDRVRAAVPLSGTGAWDVAVQSPDAWQHALLDGAGLDVDSPQWAALIEAIDAANLLGSTTSAILMVNGTTDEFFPMTAHTTTFDAIPGTSGRTSLAANLDHGCYLLTGVEDKDAIEARATLRATGGQKMWFSHWFGTDPDFQYLPAPPTVQVEAVGLATMVVAQVDQGGSGYAVEMVRYWLSNDDSFLYAGQDLDPAGSGIYSGLVPAPLQPNSIYYVDVQYKTKEILFPTRFSISSRPHVPGGLVPHIRDKSTCM